MGIPAGRTRVRSAWPSVVKGRREGRSGGCTVVAATSPRSLRGPRGTTVLRLPRGIGHQQDDIRDGEDEGADIRMDLDSVHYRIEAVGHRVPAAVQIHPAGHIEIRVSHGSEEERPR